MVVDQLWEDDVFEEPQPLAGKVTHKSVTSAKELLTKTARDTAPESTSYNFALPEAEMPPLRANQIRFQQLQQQVLRAEADMASASEAFSVATICVEKCTELLHISKVIIMHLTFNGLALTRESEFLLNINFVLMSPLCSISKFLRRKQESV